MTDLMSLRQQAYELVDNLDHEWNNVASPRKTAQWVMGALEDGWPSDDVEKMLDYMIHVIRLETS